MRTRNALAAAALAVTLLAPTPVLAAGRGMSFWTGVNAITREVLRYQAQKSHANIRPRTPEARRDTILGIPSVGTKYRCAACRKFVLRKKHGEKICPSCRRIVDRARRIGKAAWVRVDTATGPTLRYIQATGRRCSASSRRYRATSPRCRPSARRSPDLRPQDSVPVWKHSLTWEAVRPCGSMWRRSLWRCWSLGAAVRYRSRAPRLLVSASSVRRRRRRRAGLPQRRHRPPRYRLK